jgi:hypothetical protein
MNLGPDGPLRRGVHGTVRTIDHDRSLEIRDKVDPVKYVKSVREKMMSFKITEPDLTSVRDDMILALNRSLFLFSLK